MLDDPSVRYRYDMEYDLEDGCRCGSCWGHTGRWRVYDWLDNDEDEFYSSQADAFKRCEELNGRHPKFKSADYADYRSSIVTGKRKK
jgi:hypothetical protein